jgi:hypothetical protein
MPAAEQAAPSTPPPVAAAVAAAPLPIIGNGMPAADMLKRGCGAEFSTLPLAPAVAGLLGNKLRPSFPPYVEAMRCMAIMPELVHQQTESWDERVPEKKLTISPLFVAMHGGVSPARIVLQARLLAILLNVSHYRPRNITVAELSHPVKGALRDVIVELGCGNAGLLMAMCPPIPELSCAGTDFAPRPIKHAAMHLPWIDVRVAIGAPHMGDATATAVFSHGVTPYLSHQQTCAHVGEGLRLLRPRGRLVFWMIHIRDIGTRHHPAFWEEGGRVLQFCPGLARLVKKASVYRQMAAAVYSADFAGMGFYGVRLLRNDAPFARNAGSGAALPPLWPPRKAPTPAMMNNWTAVMASARVSRITNRRAKGSKTEKWWLVGGQPGPFETDAMAQINALLGTNDTLPMA